MKTQNFKNHSRLVPGYHFLTGILLLIVLGGAVTFVIQAAPEQQFVAWLMLGLTLVVIGIFWYARVFALKAQDRAIRSEESFRYYLLTGKPVDPRIKLSQLIALRFASDAEFVELVNRAVAENLSATEIKKAVRDWRGDYHRA